MTLERAKQIIQENFGDKYDVEFSLAPANIQQKVQPDIGDAPAILDNTVELDGVLYRV